MYFECVPHVSATDQGINIHFLFFLIENKESIKQKSPQSVAVVLDGEMSLQNKTHTILVPPCELSLLSHCSQWMPNSAA